MKLEFYHGTNDVSTFDAPDDTEAIIVDKKAIIYVDRDTPDVITFRVVPDGAPNVKVALTSVDILKKSKHVATKLKNVGHIRIDLDRFGKLD